MNTRIHSILSASAALGLASFTSVSAFVLGVAAPATLLSFGLLAVYGLLEITLVSYQSPRLIRRSPRAVAPTVRARGGVSIVHFPAEPAQEVLRAA